MISRPESYVLAQSDGAGTCDCWYFPWEESSAMDYASPAGTDASTDLDVVDEKNQTFAHGHLAAPTASGSSDKSGQKISSSKTRQTLRRLAQNREAARRTRLKKKAYVQQLENSSLKLAQLEQELQRARKQGIFVPSLGDRPGSASGNGGLAFDVEYARWLEEHGKKVDELSAAVGAHAGDGDLKRIADAVTASWEEIFRLRGVAAKADAFHVLAGTWTTTVERYFFLWLGGFRPSELLTVLARQLEPLTEKQLGSICSLRQSSQRAEEALSGETEALRRSIAETVASGSPCYCRPTSSSSGNVADDDRAAQMMAAAMAKLGADLETLLQQADDLRVQTLRQMQRILTTRQSARALLAISGYFSRMRALSSHLITRSST